jgi:hypothetical protein
MASYQPTIGTPLKLVDPKDGECKKPLLSVRNNTLQRNISLRENTISRANLTGDREFSYYLSANLRNTPYPGVENYTWYAVTRLGLLSIDNAEPLIPEFGPVINDVLSFQYPISISSCQDHISAIQTVVILVNSAPDNFKRRKMIRQTWKNHLMAPYVDEDLLATAGFAFFVALTENDATQNKIEEEANTYGDSIQIAMSDFYRNLSLKVAGLFNWLYRNCAKVDFVVKVDDDVYVNVHNLAQFVQTHSQYNQSMFGSAAGNLWPARSITQFSFISFINNFQVN